MIFAVPLGTKLVNALLALTQRADVTYHRLITKRENMRSSRRRVLIGMGSMVAAPFVAGPSFGQDVEFKLKLHHFLARNGNVPAKFIAPWARKIETESKGRIKIDLFPSMQLGGSPQQLFDQARDGVVDIVWTLPAYTAGRFPMIEVFDLPFIGARKAVPNSKALQEFSERHLRDEFKEVHPICFFAQDHGVIHANKPIRTLDDLRGMRLRFSARLLGDALRSVGVNAVSMPVPQVPEALAQRVIDGLVLAWEAVPTLKIHELVRFHTEIPGSPTLSTTSFLLAMNHKRYESLPGDLKAVIDANSGMRPAAEAGAIWDNEAAAVTDLVRKRNNTIQSLPDESVNKWRKAVEPIYQGWVKQISERGQNGQKLLESARELVAKYASG
ncbi:MAG TPA: TRAP transporter substrate-binding protein [Burkholderiales bacterium]|jgi:TRAP-type C4-dicarboxylate transport system substrate-binding protein|nr:TRAP transporter substrate-binding protein [Burkholderiales bacterium]